MTQPVEQLGKYLHLARASKLRQRPHVTDRLLAITGSMCVDLKLPLMAAHCRDLILQHNPHHVVGRFPDFATAVYDEEFDGLLKQLYRRYPLEKVEKMLQSLGVITEGERASYFDDLEYVAAIWGTTPQALNAKYG